LFFGAFIENMRKEQYFINGTYTIEVLIDETLTNPHLSIMMSTIVIYWMYFILLFDNHIDLILRLFRSNRFIF
jgi:hypothetical protein